MKNTDELLDKFNDLLGEYAFVYGNCIRICTLKGNATKEEASNVIASRKALTDFFLETIKEANKHENI